jgi:peptidoglycan-N-acetylglucosamine deacetylase
MSAPNPFPWQRIASIALAFAALKSRKNRELLGLGAAALWTWPGWLQNEPGPFPVMQKFVTDTREVWLTIDDGPGRHDTHGMLAALEEADARATFFPIASKAEQRPDLIRDILKAGHTTGNHTYSHRTGTFWFEPGFSVAADIVRAQEILGGIAGTSPIFYRAPAGRWTWEQVHAVRQLGLTCIGWSAAGGDGSCAGDLWEAMNRIVEQLTPGSIIVLHQGGRPGRVEALRYLLHRLAEGGWKTTLPGSKSLENARK